jgi:hypothetical protein
MPSRNAKSNSGCISLELKKNLRQKTNLHVSNCYFNEYSTFDMLFIPIQHPPLNLFLIQNYLIID